MVSVSNSALVLSGSNALDLRHENILGTSRLSSSNAIHPALRPPEWGMPQISWAHRQLERDSPGSYAVRLEKLHQMEVAARKIPSMHRINGGTMLQIFDALYTAFGEAKSISSFADLEGRKAQVSWFIDKGLIQHAISGKNTRTVNSSRLRKLDAKNAEDYDLDIIGYRKVADQEKDFLNSGSALLLVPAKHDPNLVVVTLKPIHGKETADERYLNFFERLQEKNISYAWNHELSDLLLGCYDSSELSLKGLSKETRRLIFPQYSGPQFEARLDPITIECRNESENGLIGIHIGEVKSPSSQTLKYRSIMQRLAEQDIALEGIFNDFEEIKESLSSEQTQLTAQGVANVVFDYLRRGQIKSISPIDRLPQELALHIEMSPSDARELRRLYQSLDPQEALTIGACFQHNGRMGQECAKITMPGISEEIFPRLNGREWDMAHSKDIDDPELQEKLRKRACCYLSHVLKASVETENLYDTGRQIGYYSQILALMHGRSGHFERDDSNRVSVVTGVKLVHFLEHSIGLELPELRAQVARSHRKAKMILDLTPFTKDKIPLADQQTSLLFAQHSAAKDSPLATSDNSVPVTAAEAIAAAKSGELEKAAELTRLIKERLDGTSVPISAELKKLDARLRIIAGDLTDANVLAETHDSPMVLADVRRDMENAYGKETEIQKTIAKWSDPEQWGVDGYKLTLCVANRKLNDLFYAAAEAMENFEESENNFSADSTQKSKDLDLIRQYCELAKSIENETELRVAPALNLIFTRLKIYQKEITIENLHSISELDSGRFTLAKQTVIQRLEAGEDWAEIAHDMRKKFGLGGYILSAFFGITKSDNV